MMRLTLSRTRAAVAAFDAGEVEGHVVADAFADDTRDRNDYNDPYARLYIADSSDALRWLRILLKFQPRDVAAMDMEKAR